MQSIYKTPGYLLVLIGAFCLSWGGLLVREFDGADIWQILFWRAFFFYYYINYFYLQYI